MLVTIATKSSNQLKYIHILRYMNRYSTTSQITYTYGKESTSESIGNYIYSYPPIGEGSFSFVFKGYDTVSDCTVAIKKINKQYVSRTIESTSRVHTEIELLKKLNFEYNHPHIIKILNVIENEKYIYIVLEYCNEGDLSSLLKAEKLPLYIARNYTCQIVSGLKFMYDHHILHRDLKPSNILITSLPDKTKILKLTDFNFAKLLNPAVTSLTSFASFAVSSTVCGSPLYMAPEIVMDMNPQINSDVWSLGMIVYEMVYGEHPYKNCNSIVELTTAIRKRKIMIKSSTEEDEIPTECIVFIDRMLIIDYRHRLSWNEVFENSWISNNLKITSIIEDYSSSDSKSPDTAYFPKVSSPIVIRRSSAISTSGSPSTSLTSGSPTAKLLSSLSSLSTSFNAVVKGTVNYFKESIPFGTSI